MVRAPRSIPDYDELMNPLRERRQAVSGPQIGDPALLVAAVMRLVTTVEPPAHLLLGSDALRLVSEKLDLLRAELVQWKDLTLSTDSPT
jgi:hypothetical protein